MRIISQNKTINIPYEKVMLMEYQHDDYTVIDACSCDYHKEFICELGKYRDCEIADSIMEEIAGLDAKHTTTYHMPEGDLYDED